MKGVVLRRNVYWLRRRVNGALMQFSLETHDEAEAIRKAQQFLLDARRPDVIEAMELGAALEDFIAYKRGIHNRPNHLRFQRQVIAGAFGSFGSAVPARVTQAQVEAWLASKENPRTRIQYLEVLSRFFRWLVERRKLRVNPCDKIERPKKVPKAVRKRFLTPEDARLLLDTPCDEGLKFALYCALHAGLRIGEVCAARPEWFDLKAGLLHVTADAGWQAKDGDNRTVPLTKEFLKFLNAYGLRSPYMLRPEKAPGKHYHRVELKKPFAAHLAKCGITGCTFHDLRRTFASLHVSAGTPIFLVARWIGDGIGVVERHYGHLHQAGDDIERVWARPKKKRPT